VPAAPDPAAPTPRETAAIAAALAAIDGRPVDEADPAARRAAAVIRAIQQARAAR
jgi:predicted DNA-binding transcriptional regulator YafY